LVQADDIKFKMATEDAEPSAEIALWQDVDREPTASNSTSFPCYMQQVNFIYN